MRSNKGDIIVIAVLVIGFLGGLSTGLLILKGVVRHIGRI